jgi:hypothetical protein
VLLAGYFFPTPRFDAALVALTALPGIGTLLRYTLHPHLINAAWPMLMHDIFSPGKTVREPIPKLLALRPSQIQASVAETAQLIPSAFGFSRLVRRLRSPVMIVVGDGDRVVNPKAHSIRLHEELPHSELRVIGGAGHMVHHTGKEEVLKAIRDAVRFNRPDADASTEQAPMSPVALRDAEPVGCPEPGSHQVRPAGPEAMRDPPQDWEPSDQASDESFPASDPPAVSPGSMRRA